MPILNTFSLRTRGATLTAMAGGAVAIMMHVAGGELARHLPPPPLMQISALLGAALAGVICADGYGRGRWYGHLLGVVTFIVATALGALSGAVIAIGVQAAFEPSVPISAGFQIAPFGLIAVWDGLINSIPVAITWVISMATVHLLMLRYRHATI